MDELIRETRIEDIDKAIEANPDAYLKNKKQLLKAFDQYESFLKDFYGENAKKFNFLNNDVYVWNDIIAIVCMNTALTSDENHYKPQIVDIYSFEKIKNEVAPCIAIMHHDYYAISDI